MGRLGHSKKGANLIIPHQVEHGEGAMHHLHHHKKGRDREISQPRLKIILFF